METFLQNLEFHRKDGRVFDIIAHPFFPLVGEDEESSVRFRPMIYNMEDSRHIGYVATLDSEETADDAIAAGLQYAKEYK